MWKKFILIVLFLILSINFNISQEIYKSISIVFSGDIFLQRQVFNSYYDKKSKKYSFSEEIFDGIKEDIKGDLSCVVLDTVVAGNIFLPSSYPIYNAPYEILDVLKDIGFTLMITATNHSLDKGERGIIETIKNIKNRNLSYLGTNLSPNIKERVFIFEKEGIKVGILAYTYGTNGFYPPKGKEYMVNYIDLKKISKDIEYLKNQNVDFIITYLHWGEEYKEKPKEYQRDLAKKLVSLGVNLIIGSHPHCVGTFEKINGSYCFYSLGNFFADQYGLYIPKVKFGLTIKINLLKEKDIKYNIEITPLFIYRKREKERYRYKIIKAKDIYNYKDIGKKDISYYEYLIKLLGSNLKWEKGQEVFLKL